MTESFSNNLKEQIELRYAMFDREQNGNMNIVIDSYAPKMMVIGDMQNNINRIPSTAYAISDYIANSLNVRQLPLQYMLEILGFKKSHIKQLLLKTKDKKMNMIFSGFGGTGVNTWHWLSKMMEWTGVINLFDNVAVYDDDDIEISNILRFPIDLNKSVHSTKKVGMFKDYTRMSKNKATIREKRFPPKSYPVEMNPMIEKLEPVVNDDGVTISRKTFLTKNTFIYGAPDLDSRAEFSHMKFIAGTHGDDGCSLVINPEVDATLQVESYGLIRLNSFFMNQLRMAIGLLEFLSADDVDKWNTPNETVFSFNFKDFIMNNEQGKTEKTIHFQIEHDGLMQDEG